MGVVSASRPGSHYPPYGKVTSLPRINHQDRVEKDDIESSAEYDPYNEDTVSPQVRL